MQFDNIPQYLKGHQRFCLWRYEVGIGGRVIKVPYNAKTHKRARTNDIKTFTDYNTAIQEMGEL
ncbi:hypothetical protein WMI_00170 [Enterococcus faecalis EnGen0363]|uniref:hypothetical protein n=1 Tax=Enterococcus faecalis TaxID=1351 RepID=UPI0003307A67|nr:hypothetical protein [Enterococcus faecalis]EIA1377395.1 hypothetical protein [Enterococcus faecalis]EOJ58621.1 hypothetical protein WMI_00170 [Enterococcus faecalis EnGen0363]MCD0885556.1 hypothetical protein [Staphylococcus aureus]